MFLLSNDEKRLEILTGIGLDKILTKNILDGILREMLFHFKNGALGKGIFTGLNYCREVLDQEEKAIQRFNTKSNIIDKPTSLSSSSSNKFIFFIIALFALFLGYTKIISDRATCQECNTTIKAVSENGKPANGMFFELLTSTQHIYSTHLLNTSTQHIHSIHRSTQHTYIHTVDAIRIILLIV
jgi:uncharacterized membrane protein YgcG